MTIKRKTLAQVLRSACSQLRSSYGATFSSLKTKTAKWSLIISLRNHNPLVLLNSLKFSNSRLRMSLTPKSKTSRMTKKPNQTMTVTTFQSLKNQKISTQTLSQTTATMTLRSRSAKVCTGLTSTACTGLYRSKLTLSRR